MPWQHGRIFCWKCKPCKCCKNEDPLAADKPEVVNTWYVSQISPAQAVFNAKSVTFFLYCIYSMTQDILSGSRLVFNGSWIYFLCPLYLSFSPSTFHESINQSINHESIKKLTLSSMAQVIYDLAIFNAYSSKISYAKKFWEKLYSWRSVFYYTYVLLQDSPHSMMPCWLIIEKVPKIQKSRSYET